MDPIALLKKDHAAVKALLKEAEELGDRAHAARAKLFERIDRELTLHSKIEEDIFYPALKAKTKANTEDRDEVLEAYEEHASAKALIAKLEGLDPRDESYKAKLQVLGEMVKHHIKEEEGEMFKEARRLLDASELDELGEEMQAEKTRSGARSK